MRPYTMELSDWVANLQYEALPRSVIAKASELFSDWLSCCIGGSESQSSQIVFDYCRLLGTAEACTIVGRAERSSAFGAALINGVSSHALELDDVHNASVFHPAVTVMPAALAAAEDLNASGQDLVLAIVIGYEISIRLGECLGLDHYKYFHTTSTAGTVGAAAAVASLFGESAIGVASALGNAGTCASGLWQFLPDKAMSKQFHAGHAAAEGAMAAYLANRGLVGASRIFEGERGLCRAMSSTPDWEKLVEGLDSPTPVFKILEVSLKQHACCRHIHPAIDGVLEIISDASLDPSTIGHIEVDVYTNAYDLLNGTNADSRFTAMFCLPYCIARAVLHGSVGSAAFSERSLRDSATLAFMDRVSMRPSTSMDAHYPQVRGSTVRVTTTSRQYEKTILTPKGDPGNPLTSDEKRAKFAALAGAKLSQEAAVALFQRCYDLSEAASVRILLDSVLRG